MSLIIIYLYEIAYGNPYYGTHHKRRIVEEWIYDNIGYYIDRTTADYDRCVW